LNVDQQLKAEVDPFSVEKGSLWSPREIVALP
jgi:hypothetical protein